MTAYHDSQSIEARKARYSRELAAYTLRQWDLARQTMESSDSPAQNGTAARPSTTSSRDRSRSGSVPPDSERAARIRQGIHAHDYAQGARRHVNGAGRAVTAGKA